MTRLWSKEALSYAFYDFANSSYGLLILTFTYGLYFKSVVMDGSSQADFWWGVVTAVPVFVVAFLSPVLGALVDHLRAKKFFLVLCTLVAVGLTGLLATVDRGEMVFGGGLVVMASIFYYLALLFYDSLIVDVSDKTSVGKISGFSWGLGYVGGILALLLVSPLIKPGLGEENLFRYQMSFVVTALFFLLFALPTFFFVKQKIVLERKYHLFVCLKNAWHDLFVMWKERHTHRSFFLLIIAYFFYNDGLSTLFAFVSLFASSTIGMSVAQITVLFLVAQLVAFPAAWFFGNLADRLGQKKIIFLTLSLCLIFSSAAAFSSSPWMFFTFISLGALGIGASQSCTRALIRRLIPEQRSSQFFGFQSFLGKFSSFLGPLLFGLLSSTFQSQRIAFLVIPLFLIVGMIVLTRVQE